MSHTNFPIDPITMDRRLPKDLVYEAITEAWVFKDGFPLAKDIDKHHCPSCHEALLMHKGFHFFKKANKSRTSFRCDVTFKCQVCSYVFPKGVVIPPEEWRDERNGTRYTHDVVRDILTGSGKGVTTEDLLKFVADFHTMSEDKQRKLMELFDGNAG